METRPYKMILEPEQNETTASIVKTGKEKRRERRAKQRKAKK